MCKKSKQRMKFSDSYRNYQLDDCIVAVRFQTKRFIEKHQFDVLCTSKLNIALTVALIKIFQF